MKTIKPFITLSFLIVIGFYFGNFISKDNNISYLVGVCVVFSALFIFNLIIRSSPRFKNYFISPWNVFSTAYHVVEVYDMPQELLYEKIKEVLIKSSFKTQYTNDAKMELMAISSFCWKSWGENIYIRIRKNEKGETVMDFHSVALMQVYTWGKNEANFKRLNGGIEDSLII